MPRLRSVLLIPADGAGLDPALASSADALCFTVADGRFALEELRSRAKDGIAAAVAAGKQAFVKVNHPRTRFLRDDLEAVVSAGLTGVLLTQTVEPQDVRDAGVGLREFEVDRGIEAGTIAIYPVIGSARGLVRAVEIAAATPRAGGLVFDGREYAEDVGGREEESGPRFAHARGAVVAASRAVQGTPLVYANGIDLNPLAQAGFSGAIIAIPTLSGAANAAFAPTAAAFTRALAAREAYAAARAAGAWVARVGESVIDAETNRAAAHLLD